MEEDQKTLFRELILNIKIPCIIKNLKIPWKCFHIPFENWCTLFDKNNDKLMFEYANRNHWDQPQWEKFREQKWMSASSMLRQDNSFLHKYWVSCGYKNISEIPSECCQDVNFDFLGFPTVVNDITFWLGSQSAHTPCHYDTYGCNIVVQVYGRKHWMLFPPETPLTATRIPYEESSVYCTETFYSPENDATIKYNNISHSCYSYILEPGEILIVPNKWWHYVENKTNALSVNAWVPLVNDLEAQIDEAIIKFLMEKFTAPMSSEEKHITLNPNEIPGLLSEEQILLVLQHLLKELKLRNLRDVSEKATKLYFDYQYLSKEKYNSIVNKLTIACAIEELSETNTVEFANILKENSKRYIENLNNELGLNQKLKQVLFNSILESNTIKSIRNSLLNKINNI